MPGQLFTLPNFLKKKDAASSGGNDPTSPSGQTTTEHTQTVVTSTSSSMPAGGAGTYSGIGYAPGGGTPYSGIGYPSTSTVQTPVQTTTQQTVVHETGNSKLEAGNDARNLKLENSNVKSPTSSQASSINPQASKTAMTMQKRVGMDILTRLTQRSTQALMSGVAKAKELHVQYVDSEHVLWGILTDSGVYQIVSDLKVLPKDLQDTLSKQFKPGKYNVAPQFSPRVKRILELALSAARSLGYEFISPDHILLALAQEGEGMAAQVMAKAGLTVEALSKKVTGKKEAPGEEKKDDRGKGSVLEQFAEDLTQKAKEGKLDPVVARSVEIERVVHILSRRTKNNPVLIGDAGVGKTAVVEGLAQRIASGDVPETLVNKRILQLDLMSLIAGAGHRGEFEERLKNLIKEVKAAAGGIILFIDEIHNMVGAGSGSEGTMDASNILKPSLARGELQTIGTTTLTEYRKYIEKDPALERRFQPVLVPEPTVDQAVDMLRALRDKYEAYHKVSIPDEAIDAAVRLSQRYVGDRFLPDKAVDLIDEAASAVRLPAISLPEEIKGIQEHLKRLETEKADSEKLGDTVRLATLTRDIEELNRDLEEKKQAYELKKSTTTNVVSPEIIQEIVARWTNIPISKLTESESEKLLNLEDIMHKRLIDQERAVAAVSEAVRRGRAGLKSNKRPIGSFVFMGPTGVGKTELAKALAEILFGSEEMMVRLDMSEYMEKHEVAKLIGAPPGYVGYEEGGQLTEAVRRHPYSVVLFDEIEKAHPDVFNILIQILDDGRLTDNKGHTISFKNTIVICTSNIGTGVIQKEMLADDSQANTNIPALGTYVITPTGREIITLGDRVWELDQSNWVTKLLKDYFAGNTVSNADPHDTAHQLPGKDIDTHVIAPSGEEMITSGGRVWKRTSTTAKEWTTDTLITYFKNHMVVNALPDQPDQQLPTAKIETNAIAQNELQVVSFGDRFWKREQLTSQDWTTGKLIDYVHDSVVVSKEEAGKEAKKEERHDTANGQTAATQMKKEGSEAELSLAVHIVKDPILQIPITRWDVHVFTPKGEEVIIVGDRFWKRANLTASEWETGKLAALFATIDVSNADKDNQQELLPVGQEIEKAKKEKEAKDEEKFALLADKLLDELKKFFRPELLNRFDEVVVFRPLTREHMVAIVDLQLAGVAKLMEEQNIGFSATVPAKRELAIIGYDPIYGARPLRRTIQRQVENPISSLLIEGKVRAGDTVHFDHDGNTFVFNVEQFKAGAAKGAPGAKKPFSCIHCGHQFETELVANTTTICPKCASTDIVAKESSTTEIKDQMQVEQDQQKQTEGQTPAAVQVPENPAQPNQPPGMPQTPQPVQPSVDQTQPVSAETLAPLAPTPQASDISSFYGPETPVENSPTPDQSSPIPQQPAPLS